MGRKIYPYFVVYSSTPTGPITNAHAVHTQNQLATLKKGSKSISDYFTKAKALASSLGAAGWILVDSEFSVYLLAGLGSDYESLVTSLTTRLDPITPQHLNSFLLNHESHLQHQTQSLLSSSNLSVNATVTRPLLPTPSGNHASFPSRGWHHSRGNWRGGYSCFRPQTHHFEPLQLEPTLLCELGICLASPPTL